MERTKFTRLHGDLITLLADIHVLGNMGIERRDARIFSDYLTKETTLAKLSDRYNLNSEKVRSIVHRSYLK